MKNITFHGTSYSLEAFDALVLKHIVGAQSVTNEYCIAWEMGATQSRATRANIAASLERLVAAGKLVRADFAITGAAPAYRRIR